MNRNDTFEFLGSEWYRFCSEKNWEICNGVFPQNVEKKSFKLFSSIFLFSESSVGILKEFADFLRIFQIATDFAKCSNGFHKIFSDFVKNLQVSHCFSYNFNRFLENRYVFH